MSNPKKPPARRVPKQERARSTVDVLLEAAARVLAEDGYERATTKRIAEVAGVSVGSLYQYFPSKAAVVVALSQRQADDVLARMAATARSGATAETLEAGARGFVEAYLDTYRSSPALGLVLLQAGQRMGEMKRIADATQRVDAWVASLLARHVAQVRHTDLDLAAFVVIRAIRAVVWSVLVERPELLKSPGLADELTALAMGYLTR